MTRILRRNGVGRLPRGTRMRKVHTTRYNKQVLGHHIPAYKGDVDLGAKLREWENFYNFNRLHGAFNGKTPYEALWEKL